MKEFILPLDLQFDNFARQNGICYLGYEVKNDHMKVEYQFLIRKQIFKAYIRFIGNPSKYEISCIYNNYQFIKHTDSAMDIFKTMIVTLHKIRRGEHICQDAEKTNYSLGNNI